jgi:hypothetical protein
MKDSTLEGLKKQAAALAKYNREQKQKRERQLMILQKAQ